MFRWDYTHDQLLLPLGSVLESLTVEESQAKSSNAGDDEPGPVDVLPPVITVIDRSTPDDRANDDHDVHESVGHHDTDMSVLVRQELRACN